MDAMDKIWIMLIIIIIYFIFTSNFTQDIINNEFQIGDTLHHRKDCCSPTTMYNVVSKNDTHYILHDMTHNRTIVECDTWVEGWLMKYNT